MEEKRIRVLLSDCHFVASYALSECQQEVLTEKKHTVVRAQVLDFNPNENDRDVNRRRLTNVKSSAVAG